MRIAVSMYSYYRPWKEGRLDVGDFVRESRRAGADGVELLAPLFREPNVDRAQAHRALAETGLPCPIFSVSPNFAKPEPYARAAEVEKVRFGVDEALRFGASVVRVFAGDVADGVDFEQARSWIVEGLAESSRYAGEHGVKLALENHGRLAGRAEQVLALLQEVRAETGGDALGANPDTGNFLLVNQSSSESLRLLAPVAYMVHLKDFRRAPAEFAGFAYAAQRGERYVGAAVGEGEVDLGACVAALREAGFDGWLSIEYEGEEDPFVAVPRSIANARRL